MKAKDYLSQACRLDQMINSKLEMVEELKELAMKATTSNTTEKVSGSKTRSPMENAICKLVNLETEINADIDRLLDLKRDIQNTIDKMEDLNKRLLLELRYIRGKSWEDVANALNYSSRAVFKIHGKALREIEKIRKECSKVHRSAVV